MIELKKELGALLDCPLYSSHKRAKNWLAKIKKDPSSPGGLRRDFQKRANGNYYYMVNELNVGDVIEFGADYYTASGRKDPVRLYGVVREITDDKIVIERFSTSDNAIGAQYEN